MNELYMVFKIFRAADNIKELEGTDPNILKKVEKYLNKVSEIAKENPEESVRILHELNDTDFLDAVIVYCQAVKRLDSASKLLASYDESFTTINNPNILTQLKEELDGDDM